MIGSVVESGKYIYIYDENGSLTGQLKNGDNPGDGLVGYTGSVVNVRCGNRIYNYNSKGSLVGQTWAGESKNNSKQIEGSGAGILFILVLFVFLYPGHIFNQIIARHVVNSGGVFGGEFSDPITWTVSVLFWGLLVYLFYSLITSAKAEKISTNLQSPNHKVIAGILQKTNLTEYINNFIKEGVDDSLLTEITDADLINLGVKKTGERLQFLAERDRLNQTT